MKKEAADADEVKVKRRLDENLQGRKEAYIKILIRGWRLRKGARERSGRRGRRGKVSQLRGREVKEGGTGKEERKPRSWKE